MERELNAEELKVVKAARLSLTAVLEHYSGVADDVGREDADVWMSISMVDANGFVDTELITALGDVWESSSRLRSALDAAQDAQTRLAKLTADRIYGGGCEC